MVIVFDLTTQCYHKLASSSEKHMNRNGEEFANEHKEKLYSRVNLRFFLRGY